MSELIIVGDRVLLEVEATEELTPSGIVLPASVSDKDRVQRGRVIKVGPGYLTANPEFSDQPWRKPHDAVRYLPLQAQPGDLAYFVRKEAIELRYEGKNYIIVQHGAIIILDRPEPKDVISRIEGMLD